jgi:hypothetical protein
MYEQLLHSPLPTIRMLVLHLEASDLAFAEVQVLWKVSSSTDGDGLC